jgi:hypothetical protein
LPEALTTILGVVDPLLQRLFVDDEEVNTTLSPAQKVVAPEAEIVGAELTLMEVIVMPADSGLVHPLAEPTFTV